MKSSNLQRPVSNPLVVFLCATLCCALWGSAFPVIKTGYAVLQISNSDWATQIVFAGIRFALAGILTLIFGSIIFKDVLLPKKKSLSKIAVLSLFQTVLQYVFFYVGLAHTTGTKSSIINGAGVFFAVLISVFIFKQEKITAYKMLGCIIGFAGVVIINLTDQNSEMTFSFTGEGFIILSAVSYAFSTVLIKKFSANENPVVLSGCQFVLGAVVMIAFGFAFGGRITTFSLSGLFVIVYLAFVSAGAYTLWGILLKYNPVSRVAVFGFMTPIFGCLLSALILRESLEGSKIKTILALLLVCAGIYIVNNKDLKGEKYDTK